MKIFSEKTELISSEIANLWNSYMSDSFAICVLKHFINRVDDNSTKSLLKKSLDLSQQHIKKITNIFNEEKLTLPEGFSDRDVDVNAPRLFTDSYYLFYISNLSKQGMNAYTIALNDVSRSDIRQYFSDAAIESIELYNSTAELLLSKGSFVKAPVVEISKEIEFIKNERFLAGWLGERRPMLAMEISRMFSNILTNIIGRALITGFAQVAKSKQVAEFFFKGRDLTNKQIEEFTTILTKENIPIPSTSESFLTDSIVAPFSDKLMMFHITVLIASGIGSNAIALSSSLRRDLQVLYTKLAAEIGQYADEGVQIMISNKWMEEPPRVIDRKELAGV